MNTKVSKEKLKEKLDKRINYILSKNVSDITNEEFEVLKNKLNNIVIEENQKNMSNSWILIIMLLFLYTGINKAGVDNNV